MDQQPEGSFSNFLEVGFGMDHLKPMFFVSLSEIHDDRSSDQVETLCVARLWVKIAICPQDLVEKPQISLVFALGEELSWVGTADILFDIPVNFEIWFHPVKLKKCQFLGLLVLMTIKIGDEGPDFGSAIRMIFCTNLTDDSGCLASDSQGFSTDAL